MPGTVYGVVRQWRCASSKVFPCAEQGCGAVCLWQRASPMDLSSAQQVYGSLSQWQCASEVHLYLFNRGASCCVSVKVYQCNGVVKCHARAWRSEAVAMSQRNGLGNCRAKAWCCWSVAMCQCSGRVACPARGLVLCANVNVPKGRAKCTAWVLYCVAWGNMPVQ